MIARIHGLVRMALFVPLVGALVGFAPALRPKEPTTRSTPAYSPPPSEPSPFSRPDVMCVPSTNRFETVAPTDPSLRTQPAEVVWLTPSDAAAPAVEAADVDTFADLVNRCGGIGGRPFHVHVVRATGDPISDCAEVTSRFHPLMVVSMTEPAAWSCIVRDEHTVLVTGSAVSNADLTGAGGRLVAAGSTEGVETARLLSLVDDGRFADRKVAIVAADDAPGADFRRAAESALATKQLKPVELARADAVLEPSLDLTTLPLLAGATATARHGRPLDVYGVETASAAIPSTLDQQDPATEARLLRSVNLYAFSPVTDSSYRSSQPPNTFSQMCNRTIADAVVPRAHATTTTDGSQPPLSASFLTGADVCMLTRTAARALFSAGPTLDQPTVIRALHRLPYIDQAAPAGTPKPRPNQVVNEPVQRIEQVAVLRQVQASCSSDTTTTSTIAPAGACWAPATGWNDGGVVVNVPLATPSAVVSH